MPFPYVITTFVSDENGHTLAAARAASDDADAARIGIIVGRHGKAVFGMNSADKHSMMELPALSQIAVTFLDGRQQISLLFHGAVTPVHMGLIPPERSGPLRAWMDTVNPLFKTP